MEYYTCYYWLTIASMIIALLILSKDMEAPTLLAGALIIALYANGAFGYIYYTIEEWNEDSKFNTDVTFLCACALIAYLSWFIMNFLGIFLKYKSFKEFFEDSFENLLVWSFGYLIIGVYLYVVDVSNNFVSCLIPATLYFAFQFGKGSEIEKDGDDYMCFSLISSICLFFIFWGFNCLMRVDCLSEELGVYDATITPRFVAAVMISSPLIIILSKFRVSKLMNLNVDYLYENESEEKMETPDEMTSTVELSNEQIEDEKQSE